MVFIVKFDPSRHGNHYGYFGQRSGVLRSNGVIKIPLDFRRYHANKQALSPVFRLYAHPNKSAIEGIHEELFPLSSSPERFVGRMSYTLEADEGGYLKIPGPLLKETGLIEHLFNKKILQIEFTGAGDHFGIREPMTEAEWEKTRAMAKEALKLLTNPQPLNPFNPEK